MTFMEMEWILGRARNAIRWRLGLPVIAEALQRGTDGDVRAFYNSRLTDCDFLADPDHYERPRAEWILGQVKDGNLLEVGCGNGGMTGLLSPLVERIVAVDVSGNSLRKLQARQLPNVRIAEALIEEWETGEHFEWILLCDILEHLRNPEEIVRRCVKWLAPGGYLLITVPNGRWESNEHLHEFTLSSLTDILASTEGEAIAVSHLRDREGKRRWLVGKVMGSEGTFFDALARLGEDHLRL